MMEALQEETAKKYGCLAVLTIFASRLRKRRAVNMDFVKRLNETLHIGDDWSRAYRVIGDVDFTEARGVCKIRTYKGDVVLEPDCVVDGDRLIVTISSEQSLGINRAFTRCKYDVFLITKEQTIKLVMGSMDIIPDVSMH
nr:MAG TPA: hypothetical protein [Caudoviricetes sp.]